VWWGRWPIFFRGNIDSSILFRAAAFASPLRGLGRASLWVWSTAWYGESRAARAGGRSE
jgi:hypothetical protein